MAHYVAELIEEAHKAPVNAREEAQRRCASSILELWDHRAGLSGRRLPTDFGSIVAVLDRLDPASPQPIYFRTAWGEMERADKQGMMTETSGMWLRTAEQVDQVARETILFALGKAAEAETDRAKPWVALAEAAGADGAPDIQLIRRLIVISEYGRPENDAEIADLEEKLGRLAEFRLAVEKIEMEWRTQLASALASNAAKSKPSARGE